MTATLDTPEVIPAPAAPPRSFLLSLAAVLGVGPFAIDMYLASLPEIGADFAAPSWTVQLTLTGYLIMLGAGQLVAGPVTDAFGRRRPLLLGLSIFIAACLLAAAAPSMAVLVVARMLQGAGAAMAFVVINSAVRDRVSGDAATRAFAVLVTVTSVIPMISPAVGGWVGELFGWRPVFLVLALIGAVSLGIVFRWLPESLPAQRRVPLAFAPVLRAYAGHQRSRWMLVPLGALAGTFVYLFCYLGGASYVYQGHYGVGQADFGMIFGVTGFASVGGAVIGHRLAHRLTTGQLGVLIMVAGGVMATAAALCTESLFLLALSVGFGLLGLGACEPAFMSLCMSSATSNVGAASALLGATQFLSGALTTALIAFPATLAPWAWAATMLGVAVVSLGLALLASRWSVPVRQV
ncbi:Bcr/CflA family efflux MFS transporter [Kocuria salsicia]|uniref:Bcr/CflA family efflux MFS transporter n=1 Tax=Kocuria salsicia TaxID=664639 RepID=UPI0011A57BBA|nr:Bcr/CflA family efflux MFS transporter [Kocuria salsicia]